MPKSKKISKDFVQGKTCVFTCYDLDTFTVPDDDPDFRYCVYQVEICPTTQREHIQGYVEFNANKRVGGLRKLLGGSDIKLLKRNGNAQQARHYCMCPGPQCPEDSISKDHKDYKHDKIIYSLPIEFGKWTGKSGNQGKRHDLDDFATAVRSGKRDWELAEEFPRQWLLHSTRVPNLRSAVKPALRDPPQVTIIWGPTGLGKTYVAYDNHPIEDIHKMEGTYQWFDGYQGQPVIIFDEFRSQLKIAYLLQLLDRYPMKVPVKGSFTNWLPTHIYITSNIDPELWYPNVSPESRAALKRRITKVIHMTEPNF